MPQVQSAGHRRRSLLLVLAKGGSELEDLLKLLVHTIDCHDGGGKPVTVSLRHRRDGFGPRAHLDMLGRGHGRGECERASEGVGAKGGREGQGERKGDTDEHGGGAHTHRLAQRLAKPAAQVRSLQTPHNPRPSLRCRAPLRLLSSDNSRPACTPAPPLHVPRLQCIPSAASAETSIAVGKSHLRDRAKITGTPWLRAALIISSTLSSKPPSLCKPSTPSHEPRPPRVTSPVRLRRTYTCHFFFLATNRLFHPLAPPSGDRSTPSTPQPLNPLKPLRSQHPRPLDPPFSLILPGSARCSEPQRQRELLGCE